MSLNGLKIQKYQKKYASQLKWEKAFDKVNMENEESPNQKNKQRKRDVYYTMLMNI